MPTLTVRADHLVQVGSVPQRVTVLAGEPVCYSHDRSSRVAVGTIAVGDAVTFDRPAWIWSPSSDIEVLDESEASLNDHRSRMAALEESPKPKRFTWQRVSAIAVLGAGWLAGILAAVGVLH